MKKLTDEDIIKIMREEWDAKLAFLSEAVDVALKGKIDGSEKQLISSDLKVRHKKSSFLYTVSSVGPRDTILKTPEGKLMSIDNETLEKEYELD